MVGGVTGKSLGLETGLGRGVQGLWGVGRGQLRLHPVAWALVWVGI